jgi:hypothetical protein
MINQRFVCSTHNLLEVHNVTIHIGNDKILPMLGFYIGDRIYEEDNTFHDAFLAPTSLPLPQTSQRLIISHLVILLFVKKAEVAYASWRKSGDWSQIKRQQKMLDALTEYFFSGFERKVLKD